MAVAFCMATIIIFLHFAIDAILQSYTLAQWSHHSVFIREYSKSTVSTHYCPSQPTLIQKWDNSTIKLQWGHPESIVPRYHSWDDCLNRPETEKCKQKICNLDFAAHCHNQTELWECSMCFSDAGETRWANETLAAHCCAVKRKAEIVWISIGSMFGVVLLLALGGCMFKQTRDKRRTRQREQEIRLQDRELGAAGKTQVDGAKGTVRWAKSCRRVPVLPTSRSRTSSASLVDPATMGTRQGLRSS